MPVTISDNLAAQNPKFTINQKGGQRVVLYLVSGLDPTGDPVTAAASAVDAATGLTMPVYGSAYPYSSGLLGLRATLLEFEPFPRQSRTSVLRVTYTSPQWSLSPGGVKIRISSAASQTAIDTDSSGNPLKVYYTDPSGTVYDDDVHLLVPQPHTVLEIEQIESASPLATSRPIRWQRQFRHLSGRLGQHLALPKPLRRKPGQRPVSGELHLRVRATQLGAVLRLPRQGKPPNPERCRGQYEQRSRHLHIHTAAAGIWEPGAAGGVLIFRPFQIRRRGRSRPAQREEGARNSCSPRPFRPSGPAGAGL